MSAIKIYQLLSIALFVGVAFIHKTVSSPVTKVNDESPTNAVEKVEVKRNDESELEMVTVSEDLEPVLSNSVRAIAESDDPDIFSGRSFGDVQKCPGITCSPPPKDIAMCKVSTSTTVNPLVPMLGSKSDCCPVHVCVRTDGTSFTHYGIESEGITGSSSSYSQGTALNDFPTPSPPSFPGMNFPSFSPMEQFQPFGSNNNNQRPQFSRFTLQPPMGMNSFFGGPSNNDGPNNRFNRNIPQPMYQQPSWDINRNRRDALPQPQFFRPGPFEFYGGPQQQSVYPPRF